jgi:hypothetical protein
MPVSLRVSTPNRFDEVFFHFVRRGAYTNLSSNFYFSPCRSNIKRYKAQVKSSLILN